VMESMHEIQMTQVTLKGDMALEDQDCKAVQPHKLLHIDQNCGACRLHRGAQVQLSCAHALGPFKRIGWTFAGSEQSGQVIAL